MHIHLLWHSKVPGKWDNDSTSAGIFQFKHAEWPWIAQLVNGFKGDDASALVRSIDYQIDVQKTLSEEVKFIWLCN
jgi:hypothetical protein